MRLPRLLLAGMLLAAPLAPWVLTVSDPGAKCCPLHRTGAACCPDSACSIRRCAAPAPEAFAALPPCVAPDRSASIEPAEGGRLLPAADSSTLSLASDLPDPPPRT